MFIIGMQFGQNKVGSWNPFTLAAKKYISNQLSISQRDFFWPKVVSEKKEKRSKKEEKNDLEYAFGDLMRKI
jgi:hypothetical protein